MALQDIVLLADDLEHGDLWIYTSNHSQKYHVFRLGQKKVLCSTNTIKYGANGRPDQKTANVKPFTGWNMNKNRHGQTRKPWCKNCVDQIGRNRLTEEQKDQEYSVFTRKNHHGDNQ